jgi:divinyl chlorophyllide a 8-vinyl-reductase
MTNGPQRILVAGATGYIGRAVTRELVRRGHEVLALVRGETAAELDGADVRRADPGDETALARALGETSIHAVVSCIASRTGVPDDAWRVDYEANRVLLRVARRSGARRFVLLSAICVQRPRLAFQHAKLAFEAELAASDIDYTIVRPTAFFKSLSGQVERVKRGKPFLVFGDGTETACKPIGDADLASYIADRIDDPGARNRILPIGGPGDAITPREQGELLFELTGRTPRFRSVSPSIFRIARGALAPLGVLWPAARRKAELANIGHYYATESMLIWDDAHGRYDAEATPSTGSERLEDFYRRVIEHGLEGHALGTHKLF